MDKFIFGFAEKLGWAPNTVWALLFGAVVVVLYTLLVIVLYHKKLLNNKNFADAFFATGVGVMSVISPVFARYQPGFTDGMMLFYMLVFALSAGALSGSIAWLSWRNWLDERRQHVP